MKKKRTALEREHDIKTIERLHFSGVSLFEISKRLGISEGQVVRDFKEVQNRWKTKALEPKDKVRARMIAEIDFLIEEVEKLKPRGQQSLIAKFMDMKAKLGGLYNPCQLRESAHEKEPAAQAKTNQAISSEKELPPTRSRANQDQRTAHSRLFPNRNCLEDGIVATPNLSGP